MIPPCWQPHPHQSQAAGTQMMLCFYNGPRVKGECPWGRTGSPTESRSPAGCWQCPLPAAPQLHFKQHQLILMSQVSTCLRTQSSALFRAYFFLLWVFYETKTRHHGLQNTEFPPIKTKVALETSDLVFLSFSGGFYGGRGSSLPLGLCQSEGCRHAASLGVSA